MSVNDIHNELIDEIGNNFDKSAGGFVYDLTKAIAIKLEEQQNKVTHVVDKMDVDNLHGDELRRFVYQHTGLEWKGPTKATTEILINAAPNAVVQVGDLVAAGTVFYEFVEEVVVASIGQGRGMAMCQQPGRVGNVPTGAINSMPVTISGVTSVINLNAVDNGYNAETDQELRERYYQRLRKPGKAGNTQHYIEWAKEVVGVGKVKPMPRFNGPLTMKILIIDANDSIPNPELVLNTAQHITKEMPFGVEELLISAPETIAINVAAELTVAEGLTPTDLKLTIETEIENYLKSLIFEASYVSIAQIGNVILNVSGVVDYANLTLNDDTERVDIPENYVAVLGMVTI